MIGRNRLVSKAYQSHDDGFVADISPQLIKFTDKRRINNLVLDARLASFIGVGELKDMRRGKAAITNVTGRSLAMAIYAVGVATKAVNGEGCHDALSLKSADHTDQLTESITEEGGHYDGERLA